MTIGHLFDKHISMLGYNSPMRFTLWLAYNQNCTKCLWGLPLSETKLQKNEHRDCTFRQARTEKAFRPCIKRFCITWLSCPSSSLSRRIFHPRVRGKEKTSLDPPRGQKGKSPFVPSSINRAYKVSRDSAADGSWKSLNTFVCSWLIGRARVR